MAARRDRPRRLEEPAPLRGRGRPDGMGLAVVLGPDREPRAERHARASVSRRDRRRHRREAVDRRGRTMPGVTPPGPPGPPGLTLRPFRGLRYSGDAVEDLGAVTSPPYDVLDPDAVLALESAEPHNVVRLILPREEESGPEGRYEHAARTLRSWLDEGVLLVDEEPALYVYEQSRDG